MVTSFSFQPLMRPMRKIRWLDSLFGILGGLETTCSGPLSTLLSYATVTPVTPEKQHNTSKNK